MKEDIEKIKDLKAVYSGAVQAGELSIANIIKCGIDLIEKLQEENEELKEKWDKDTHKLQNDLDIANAERIDWEKAYQEEKDKQFDLLRENQKLQKENEKLERANKCYINSIQSIAPVLSQDYIEKQKIKDKIEEYKRDVIILDTYPNFSEQEVHREIVEILQDLLESEE